MRTKPLLFGLVLALGAAPALAQGNTALINQEGSRNVATITQVGANNLALTNQQGNDNLASITQVGNRNQANAEVATGVYLFGISQRGSRNVADVEQRGDDNVARLGVTGNDNGRSVEGNAFSIRQGSATLAVSGNYAQVAFIGDFNVGMAVQEGNDNYLYLNGRGGIFGSRESRSGLEGRAARRSHRNAFDLEQRGDAHVLNGFVAGSRNTITSRQSGTGNHIGTDVSAANQESLLTRDGVNLYGDDNVVTLTQDGNDNRAFVGVGPTGVSSFNIVTLLQQGDANLARITQQGNNHSATVSLVGNGNAVTVVQN